MRHTHATVPPMESASDLTCARGGGGVRVGVRVGLRLA